MPRKSERLRKEKRLRAVHPDLKLAIEKARKLEKERLANGWKWVRDGKTRKLIKDESI